jgi:hypothetical protein
MEASLSVAKASLAMDVERSSELGLRERLVKGVFCELPPLTEPSAGVEVPVADEPRFPEAFADVFAAFSASLFCLDEEGGIVSVECGGRRVTLR